MIESLNEMYTEVVSVLQETLNDVISEELCDIIEQDICYDESKDFLSDIMALQIQMSIATQDRKPAVELYRILSDFVYEYKDNGGAY